MNMSFCRSFVIYFVTEPMMVLVMTFVRIQAAVRASRPWATSRCTVATAMGAFSP